MSNTKMLIDATHPEETRVVVQRNGRVEEFDFESAARKLLRGNIYLAKVTRVEPSLQAAFVDYGGNRHGFLAFNEIHPDYYQIPVADRQALLDEEAAAEAELEAAADRRAEALARRSSSGPSPHDEGGSEAQEGSDQDDASESEDGEDGDEVHHIVDVEEEEHIEEVGGEGEDGEEAKVVAIAAERDETISEDVASDDDEQEEGGQDGARSGPGGDEQTFDRDENASAELQPPYESDDGEADARQEDEPDSESHDGGRRRGSGQGERQDRYRTENGAPRQRRRPRNYKIQEVIKRRQVILVQVVKEERGNKGAALTTYLSLAGRYTVLMPNTARGGGISRKITNPQDRKRLKAIAADLEVPEGMGLIIRTAGAARTKQEIKRDFEYLLRLWESVRELTLQSTAPSLVYEEGDLIKRSIRDLYNKDVEEIVVAGDGGYREAADFMTMLMPSHARNVVPYAEPSPLFARYGVERQLNAMFQPQVTLRSGGYIVINQTEALVAIDVNSGKSTREFSIEETALATNLEAADEIARQLKLRDLAGLIVIDFIDMEEKRNNRAVERRLKDALRFDRARIQLGRISHFGLMEMSRQRLRTGVLEGSTSQCQHCQGTGIIRSTESIALAVLRGIEDSITAGASGPLTATTTPAVALYILNSKRAYVSEMETRHGHSVTVLGSERVQGANFTVERSAVTAAPLRRAERAAVNMNWGFDGEDADAPEPQTASIEIVDSVEESDGEERTRTRDGESGGQRGRRRRRGRGGRERGEGRERGNYERRDEAVGEIADAAGEPYPDPEAETAEGSEQPPSQAGEQEHGEEDGNRPGRRGRRGRRGGRRGRDRGGREGMEAEGSGEQPSVDFDETESRGDADDELNGEAPALNNAAPADRETRRTAAPAAEAKPAAPKRRIWDAPESVKAANDERAETTEPAPVADPAPAAPEEPAAATPARRRHEVGSSEPRMERVVVGSAEAAPAEEAPLPQRKGWWQRKFGGE